MNPTEMSLEMSLFVPSLIAFTCVAIFGFTLGLWGGWLRWRNERGRIQQLVDGNTAMCREIEQLQSRGPAALRPAGEAEGHPEASVSVS